MNHAQKTLGAFLSSPDLTIRRNALSILKRLTNCPHERKRVTASMRVCDVCEMLFPDRMR